MVGWKLMGKNLFKAMCVGRMVKLMRGGRVNPTFNKVTVLTSSLADRMGEKYEKT